ncbi:MAG TPA: GNAT family N-acetyltransferase [Chitinophagaceae bacterium]|nr:GNAT family N-acetyltransferase [Chitinophagaceae bacterium]
MSRITIIDYLPEHQPYFEKLNRHWIEKYFFMEERDVHVLTKPGEAILDPGGAILMASYDGVIAGTVGLLKVNDSTFEFTKMAVDENFRRKGIAEALSHAALDKAKQLGAKRVVLYSHSSLTSAIALYEKLGFRHLLIEEMPYRRSDVKMEIFLDNEDITEQKKREMHIEIIRAEPSHATAISGIGRRAFTDAFGHLFSSKEELQEYLDYTYAISKLRAGIQKENNAFFLALANGRPVGFVKLKKFALNSLIDSISQMELQKIYVLKEYHGTGAGEGLMKAALELTRRLNIEYLWLDTYIGNDRGISFYKKHGFRICGRHYFTIGSQTFEYHVMTQLVGTPELSALSRVWNAQSN